VQNGDTFHQVRSSASLVANKIAAYEEFMLHLFQKRCAFRTPSYEFPVIHLSVSLKSLNN